MKHSPTPVRLSCPAGRLPLGRAAFVCQVEAALRLIGRRPVAVSIVIVDDRTIRRLNRNFLGHDYATDVITFPLHPSAGGAAPFASATATADKRRGHPRSRRPGPQSSVAGHRPSVIGHPSSVLGELYLSLSTARREARRLGIPVAEELLRYAVHGLLHLHGHDDATPAARRRMWRRQEALVRRLIGGPRAV